MPATRRKLRDVVDEDEASLPLTPSHHTQAGAVASTTPVRTPHLARRSAAASASSPYARTPNSSHRAVVARTPNNNNRLSVRPRTSEPPQSPAMRAIGGFLGLISPFSRLNAKRSAAFGTPEVESAQEDAAQEDGGSRSFEDQMMREDLPTTPGQQFLTAGPSRTSGNADYNPFTDRRYGPNVADGGGMRVSQSTPAGLANFNAHQHEPTSPQPPHYERRGLSPHPSHSQRSSYNEAASQQQQHAEQEARAAAAAAAEAAQHEREPQTGDSPLSRNYELLSRFFAEKATPGEGQTLSEIEIQGCVRLLEESLAYSSGEQDLERMRAAGAFRDNQLHAWSAAAGSSVRNAAAALRRSPSLPFGAAAGEGWHGGALLSSAAHQSRPSSSFLAPRLEGDKHNASSTDAKFAKSLANSFSPAALAASGRGAAASSSSEARRRPLYLGPGLGRGSVSALARRAARSAALARPSTASLREAPRAAVPVPAGTGEDSTKRRRVQVPDAAADAPATFIQPSTPTKDALPFTTSQQATPASNAAAPSAVATPTRSATANAILSIIAASPLPPPALPRARRSEHVNPYEATTRGTARKSAEPSSVSGSGLSARAKALRAAKEDARKRKAEADEARRTTSIEPRKETALERIERTAPLTPAKKQRAAPMPPKEKEKEDLPPVEPLDGSNDETMASAEEQQEEEEKAKEKAARKARATEEALRRMKAMQQSSTSSSSDSSKDKSDSASSSAAAAPAAKPAVASVPFTFTAPKVAQAFAPKKPSPLSLAFKPTPDSPGSSSESEDARSAGASTSQFASAVGSAKEAPPKLAFNFGGSTSTSASAFVAKQSEPEKEKEATKTKNAAPLFSFGAKAQKDATQADEEMSSPSAPAVAESSTPAAPPKTNSFNFGAPTSTPASASTSQPASPCAQALSVPSTSLPTFTLPLSAPSSSTSTAEAGTKAKAAALGDLPTFSFHFDASNKASLKVDVTAAPSSSSASASASAPISATASEDGASSAAGSSSGLLASGAGEGEEGEETKHEVRGKVWALQKGAWKDLGVGLVKLKAAEDGKRRLLVRNEVTGKPTVNFNLYAALTIKQEANVITFTGFAEGQPMNYRTKIKTAEGAAQLKAAMEQEAALCK